MSDRFVLHATKPQMQQLFKVSSARDDYFEPNYNIQPGSLHPVIIQEQEGRQLQQAQWGLIPPDAGEEQEGRETFSIPAEKIQEKTLWVQCIEKRRCLIPANGFYKWKTNQKKATPFYIRLLDNKLTAFGGIYTIWSSPSGRRVYSFAILTTKANVLVDPVASRMPVIVDPSDFEEWLGSAALSEEAAQKIVSKPYPMAGMAANRVSEQVNDPENNSPQLIQPIPK